MRASGIASAGQQSSRFRKSVHSLRLRAGVPASTGLCKRRAKPESGPRETGRRRSNEGNRSSEGNSSASQGRHPSSCPTSPACKQPNMQSIPSAQPVVLPSASPGSACSSCRSGAGARSSKSCRGQRHTTLRHCAQRHQLRLLHRDGSPSLRLCF